MDCGGDKYKGGGLNDKSFIIILLVEDDRGIYLCIVKNLVGLEIKNFEFGK